uniref:ERF family protein n=1 Tax=Aerococcus urinaeequi TaxID=51665 RepID=UPI00352BB8E8
MKHSESITKISAALVKFHEKVEQPNKSADNPFFKSKYVPLENVQTAIDTFAPPLGLTYVQETLSSENGNPGVRTMILHESGEYLQFEPLFLPLDKNTAQAAGSAITYARRYTLSAAFGISSDDDDDGNKASGNDKSKSKSAPKAKVANIHQIKEAKDLLLAYAEKTGNTDKEGLTKLEHWALGGMK